MARRDIIINNYINAGRGEIMEQKRKDGVHVNNHKTVRTPSAAAGVSRKNVPSSPSSAKRPPSGGVDAVKHRAQPSGDVRRTALPTKVSAGSQRDGAVRRTSQSAQSGAVRRNTAVGQTKPVKQTTPQRTSAAAGRQTARAAAAAPQKTSQKAKAVKRPLTPEQKARIEARRKARAEARKKMLSRLLVVLIVFLTCYTAVSLALAGILWLNFRHVSPKELCPVIVYQPKKDPSNAKEKEKRLAVCDASAANINGEVYIPYKVLSKLTDVSMVGDGSQLTVVFRDGLDELKCYAFSNSIEINGVPAALSAPVIRKNDEYYFPIEILSKYADGVNVTYEKNSDGEAYYKVVLSTYGGSVYLKNHADPGSESVSAPEMSQE